MNYTKIILITCLLLAVPFLIHAEKTDIVVLTNGDHMTGEVKKMDFGMLSFKTDHMGTISIEWDKVNSLKALNQYFRLERSDGFVLYGSIDTDSIMQKILVILDTVTIPLDFMEIVRITPIKTTFLDRLDGSVDLGYSYTKASTVSQLTFSGKGTYRALWNSIELSWGTVQTDQQDKPTSLRRDISLTAKRIFSNKWFFNALAGLQQNSELGLDLRLSGGAGGGKHLIQSNRAVLLSGAGLSLNREWTNDYTSSLYNLEGILGGQYYYFIYDHPQVSLDNYLNLYPGISDWGRWRIELNIQLKWEIIKDLYWSLSFYDSYDNRPASGGGAKNDFGVVLSLGYKF